MRGQNQDSYSLEIQGFAWRRTTINALIVTPGNESWWDPINLNASLRALGQWNEAIAIFASNYSDYAYLSSVRIEATVLNETRPGFDLYVNWTDSALNDVSDEVGLSKIVADRDSTIVNCTIILAVNTNHGTPLSEGDMQNIALHEFGHSLGLGHSNYNGDLMYPMYTLQGSAQGISTLDIYGVAAVFAWLVNSSDYYPVNEWLKKSVVLPSNIAFEYLPVSSENARPQTLSNNPIIQIWILFLQLMLHPEFFFAVFAILILFVIIALIPGRRQRRLDSRAGS